jgi:hypothetical protein
MNPKSGREPVLGSGSILQFLSAIAEVAHSSYLEGSVARKLLGVGDWPKAK